MYNTDVVIVGAGPVGLFAVFQCGMLDMKCHVVDVLEEKGGQCTMLYPEKPIFDIPGYPEIQADILIEKLVEQGNVFQPTYHLGQEIQNLTQHEDGDWIVSTSRNLQIKAKAVIIAAGKGAFVPKKPPLQNLEIYEQNDSVEFFVRNKGKFANKKVAIAGGGDSAIDWTMTLADIVDKIFLIHRREKFSATPHSLKIIQELQKKGKVELITPFQLSRLQGNTEKLEQVIVKNNKGEEKSLEVDNLLLFFGMAGKIGSIKNWNLDIVNNIQIKVDIASMQTNLPGIYAVGDISNYENKVPLILVGFSEVSIACHHMYGRVKPNDKFSFQYSTTKKIPGK